MAIKIVEREVIKDDAITAAKVEDGTVVAADLTTNFITNAHVKSDAAIAASKITGLATSATTDTTNASNIASGTLPTARLDTGTTANKIVQLDSNAKLPAISGANLTGIESATVSTSDPVITTNPSGGIGTKWINKTSGEVYVCTDATAGSNVWTNIGAGSGDVFPYTYQGTQYGYTSGGGNHIQRHSFTSDGNATDIADLTRSMSYSAGNSSLTHGYVSGGGGAPNGDILKFAFASGSPSTDTGYNLTTGTVVRANMDSSGNSTHGYIMGGSETNIIERITYATDGAAVDVGDLLQADNSGGAGASSATHGYNAAGYITASDTLLNVIQKFAFGSSVTASDVGDMNIVNNGPVGASSTTHGYTMGGSTSSGTYQTTNAVEKYTFASDNNATIVGNTTVGRYQHASSSSTTHGYAQGNYTSGNGNVIEKVSFTTDGNATDVGDLVTSVSFACGQHY